jgi:hypothetical protein
VTSPRIEELPEELVEAFEKVIARSADERQKYLSGPNADVWHEEPSGDRQTAEELLRLALSTGRLMLVPEGQVGVVLEREEAEMVVHRTEWAASSRQTTRPHRLIRSARSKLSQALAQVEADER